MGQVWNSKKKKKKKKKKNRVALFAKQPVYLYLCVYTCIIEIYQ